MMKGSIGQLMKQAQKMQEKVQKAQEELATIEVTGEAVGGLVSVTMTCRHVVRSIRIDDSLYGDDKDMLEDLLAAAFNDAIRKVDEQTKKHMGSMAAGLNLPPGMNLPF
ncbi:MAG: YbaB/EbfC family nucleoid-associated protein [Pseudomonadota bacterium]